LRSAPADAAFLESGRYAGEALSAPWVETGRSSTRHRWPECKAAERDVQLYVAAAGQFSARSQRHPPATQRNHSVPV